MTHSENLVEKMFELSTLKEVFDNKLDLLCTWGNRRHYPVHF